VVSVWNSGSVTWSEWSGVLLGIPVHIIILPEDGPSRPKHVRISSRVSNKVHVHIVVLDGITSYLLL
jgi:hypothetical protein